MSPRVLALAGSARQGSLNGILLDLAVSRLKGRDVDVARLDLRALDLPIYDGDLEEPRPVEVLRRAISGASALLIASPEYNHSIPPLLKNAIDWVSHPIETSPFPGKLAALMSAAARPWGGTRMLPHLRDVLVDLGVLVLPASVAIPVAHRAFTPEGRLLDPQSDAHLGRVIDAVARLGA
jgi:chromate reductase, NAD(P)H dehydrogenase (quinone)